MRITKKAISILVMVIGILILSMTAVSAQSLPVSNKRVVGSKLNSKTTYSINYNTYANYENLHCAQPNKMLRKEVTNDYKLIAHVHIEGNEAYLINSDKKKIKKSKIEGRFNLKMATGVATLSEAKQGEFLWGYLKDWTKKASEANTKYYGKLKGFALKNITEKKNPNWDEVNETVEKRMKKFGTTEVKKFKIEKDEDNFNYADIDNYKRLGPYVMTNIPSTGLASFTVADHYGNEIKKASLITYTEDKERKEIAFDKIKEGQKFYICVPKNRDTNYINVTVKTNKIKGKIPECDIYFLDCLSGPAWQNLVVTEGDTTDNPDDGDGLEDSFNEDMPGELTIIKESADNKDEKLPGAEFLIFRYVKDDDGIWYKKGDTYTKNKNEADDKDTKYIREYIFKKSANQYSYIQKNEDNIKNKNYIFTTDKNGKIELDNLKPATYFAQEVKAPEGYKKSDEVIKLGKVVSNKKKDATIKNTPDGPKTTYLCLRKVDKDNNTQPLEGIRFKFKTEKGWLQEISVGQYQFVDESQATWFTTDKDGQIYLHNVPIGNWTYKEDPTSVPEGYDITGAEEGTFQLEKKEANFVLVENKQKYVKLSGFVWVDKVGVKSGDGKDRNDLFKTNQDGNHPDEKDLLFDGITVRLKDEKTGNTVKETVTSNLGRYTEYGHNGHGEYLFENVEIDKLGDYYIEFTYDGLNYTNVVTHIDHPNGSKAGEKIQNRTDFNNQFSVIEGRTKDTGVARGTDGKETALKYTIDEKEKTATLNNDGKYTETDSYIVQDNIGDFVITAETNRTGYSIINNFKAGQTEIRNINLGLKDRDRPDIALGKDLQNIKISINGYNHVYDYAQRYKSGATEIEGEDSFNVGVKYKNDYTGTYTRAIYKADYEYQNDRDKSKELEVYITYRLSMAQSNINLQAKVNSITDYFDSQYSLERIGTELNKDKSVGGTIIAERKDGALTGKVTDRDITNYGDGKKYKKVTIPCDRMLEKAQIDYDVYVQFKLRREQVLNSLRDKGVGEKADELLNNVAEINSYSILENGKPYAGVDKDSNPGNCDPENKETYEDDTSASAGIQLEVANARVMTGKVFIDNHEVKSNENPSGVMTGMIRQGNGKYDDGEAKVKGVPVILTENTGSGKVYTAETNGDGDFTIENYIPGDYTLTYTWGGQTYELNGMKTIEVQYYKGTVYDSKRDQNNKRWWYVATKPDGTKELSERLTDAIDNYNKDQTAPKGSRLQIDEELKNLNKDTMTNITRKQMDSTTPTMGIGVEYETTYSASTGDRYVYRIDNIDFGIIERPKQDLLLTKRVKSMKVTLANGQVIANLTVNNETGEIQGEKNGVTYMKPSANIEPKNGFIRLELDNELIQGTKLEVEYEITVKNNSELDYLSEDFYKYGINPVNQITMTPTGIVDYLDKNWSFDNKNGENNNWQVMQVDDDFRKLVIEEVYDNSRNSNTTIGQKMILYTKQLEHEKLEATQSKSITFNVSKILTTTDEIALNNEVEEVTATKTGGSMIQSTLGNYVPGEGPTESDDSMAETTIVTPATGENRDYILPIIIGATALIILGAGVIIIKKKVV